MLSLSLLISVNALLSNRFRLFLTILGLSLGIASVITVMALNKGAKTSLESFLRLKKGWYTIEPDILNYPGIALEYKTCKTLCHNSSFIKKAIPTKEARINFLGPWYNRKEDVIGTSEEFILYQEILAGRFLNKEDVLNGNYVCIAVKSILKGGPFDRYFDYWREPVGEKARVESSPVELVGILKPDMWGEGFSFDNIIMPVTTVIKITGDSSIDKIEVQLPDLPSKEAFKEIEKILKIDYKYKYNQFKIQSSEDTLKEKEEMVNFSGLILFSAALITILVAGTGIINILMVSVSNRIMEIGIRRASGASKKDILLQFLTEAIILCTVSSIPGILIGYYSTGYLTGIINEYGLYSIKLSGDFDWSGIIIFAVVFSALLGIIFGIYPAYEASKLDIVDCLRQGEGGG